MNSFTKHRITVFGINGCHDAIKSSIIDVNQIIIERNSPADISEKMTTALTEIPQNLIEKVDSESFKKYVDNNRAQGIFIKAQAKTFNELPIVEDDTACFVVLDQVQDPHNLGQILRICAGGNIDGVVITDRNSVSMTSAVAQVSQGGFSKVPLFSVTNINKAISHFKDNDFWITSFENNIEAKDWYAIDLKGRSVLIFGGEGSGISKQVLKNSDFLATIPMSHEMNSLNVATAVSAIVFERLRQVLSSVWRNLQLLSKLSKRSYSKFFQFPLPYILF